MNFEGNTDVQSIIVSISVSPLSMISCSSLNIFIMATLTSWSVKSYCSHRQFLLPDFFPGYESYIPVFFLMSCNFLSEIGHFI